MIYSVHDTWEEQSRAVYASFDWWYLQEEVLEKADWICTICAMLATVAHHKTYRYGILCEKRYLLAVCRVCHLMLHGMYDREYQIKYRAKHRRETKLYNKEYYRKWKKKENARYRLYRMNANEKFFD